MGGIQPQGRQGRERSDSGRHPGVKRKYTCSEESGNTEKPGGRQALAQGGQASQDPKGEGQGLSISPEYADIKQVETVLDQKNKIACELTASV